MGDPKVLTRFREFCDAYEAEYAFEGVVESIQPLEPLKPIEAERTGPRGISVRSTQATRFVQFEQERMPPVVVGDTVIVVGLDGWRVENSVLPAVLLNPAKRYAWFFKDLRPGTRCESFWGTPMFVIAFGIFLIAEQFTPLRGTWSYVVGILFLLCAAISGAFVLEYNKRPRLYRGDEKTWHVLTTEVAERFGAKI